MVGSAQYADEEIVSILRAICDGKRAPQIQAEFLAKFGRTLTSNQVRYIKNKYGKCPKFNSPLVNNVPQSHEQSVPMTATTPGSFVLDQQCPQEWRIDDGVQHTFLTNGFTSGNEIGVSQTTQQRIDSEDSPHSDSIVQQTPNFQHLNLEEFSSPAMPINGQVSLHSMSSSPLQEPCFDFNTVSHPFISNSEADSTPEQLVEGVGYHLSPPFYGIAPLMADRVPAAMQVAQTPSTFPVVQSTMPRYTVEEFAYMQRMDAHMNRAQQRQALNRSPEAQLSSSTGASPANMYTTSSQPGANSYLPPNPPHNFVQQPLQHATNPLYMASNTFTQMGMQLSHIGSDLPIQPFTPPPSQSFPQVMPEAFSDIQSTGITAYTSQAAHQAMQRQQSVQRRLAARRRNESPTKNQRRVSTAQKQKKTGSPKSAEPVTNTSPATKMSPVDKASPVAKASPTVQGNPAPGTPVTVSTVSPDHTPIATTIDPSLLAPNHSVELMNGISYSHAAGGW